MLSDNMINCIAAQVQVEFRSMSHPYIWLTM